MRSAIFFIAAMVVACSDASQGSKDPIDAAAASDASAPDDVATTDDASADAEPADALPSQGGCAACTANQCLNELQACGGSQDCLNDLIDFNTCLSTAAGNCGTKLAAGGKLESSLWSCLASKCTSTCGTQ